MSFILLGILNAQAEAAAVGDYDLLETTILDSSASSVSFTGLDSYTDYKHLQIRAVARTDRASTADATNINLNSDTGSNYAFHGIGGNGSSVFSFAETTEPTMVAAGLAANNSTANAFGAQVIDFLDFSSTTKNTTMRALDGEAGGVVQLDSGLYINTGAVTSIALEPRNGTNFVTGTRFSLYGIKAA